MHALPGCASVDTDLWSNYKGLKEGSHVGRDDSHRNVHVKNGYYLSISTGTHAAQEECVVSIFSYFWLLFNEAGSHHVQYVCTVHSYCLYFFWGGGFWSSIHIHNIGYFEAKKTF